MHLPTLYQDVLMKRVTLASALPALASTLDAGKVPAMVRGA